MKRMMKMISLLTIFSTSLIFWFSNVALANTKSGADEVIKKYKELDSIMEISSGWLYDDFIRSLGWGIVRMLVWINNYLEDVVMKVITLNDFYSSPLVADLMDVMKPIVGGLFVIAVFVLGYLMIINKLEKRNEIFLNVLLAMCIILIIPNLMGQIGKVLNAGIVQMDSNMPSLADSIVKSNVADIKYYAINDFKTDGTEPYNGDENTLPRPPDMNDTSVGTSEMKFGNTLPDTNADLWITEKLDTTENKSKGGISNEQWYKDLDDAIKTMLGAKIVPTGDGDAMKIVKLREKQVTFTQLGKESYFRYSINWGVTIFSLLITSFALAITVIKIGRAVFDLAFHQIFGMFVAVTDLTGGQRIKKVLTEIVSTFAVIFVMVFILQLFILYANWTNTLSSSIGAIGVILLLIAGAWAVMDAPDIVTSVLGIDAGLKSAHGALMGAYAGSKLAGGLAKGAGKVASAGIKGGVGGASFTKGMIGGMSGRGSSNNDQSNIKEMPDGDGNPPNGGGSGIGSDPPIPPNGGGGGIGSDPPIPPNGGGGGIGGDPPIPPNGGGGGIGGDPPIPANSGGGGNGTQGRNTQSGIPNKNTKGNQGVKQNTGQNKANANMPSSQVSAPVSNDPSPSNNASVPLPNNSTVTPTMPSQSEPVQQVSQSSGGGIVTGNRYVQSVANVASRSANSGQFVGQSIHRATRGVVRGTGAVVRGTGKATVNVARVVSNPRSAVSHAGTKTVLAGKNAIRTGTNATKDVIGKGTQRMNTGKERADKVVTKIRTPFGK